MKKTSFHVKSSRRCVRCVVDGGLLSFGICFIRIRRTKKQTAELIRYVLRYVQKKSSCLRRAGVFSICRRSHFYVIDALIRHRERDKTVERPSDLARPRHPQRPILLLLLAPRSPCRVPPAAVPAAAAAAALLVAVGRAVAVALDEGQFLA